MGRLESEFLSLGRAVHNDIFKFCELLGFEPTPQQAELFQCVNRGDRRIAVKSGHGTGKSAGSGVVGLWRAFRHYGARTVVTAPTMRQCKEIWLTELRKTLEKSVSIMKRLIVTTKTKVEIAGVDKWGCELVTATDPINAQGYHNDHLTFIVEEASGVDMPFIEAIEGTLTQNEDRGCDSLFLQIGNPNRRSCSLFECFNSQRHRWSTLTFDSRKSPLTSTDQISYLAEKYGEDSDVFRIRVKGEFPQSDPECIMSAEDCEACTNTKILEFAMTKQNERLVRQFGCDFARFGGDENVIMRRSGLAIPQWGFWPHTDPSKVIDLAFKWQADAGWRNEDCTYVGDADGMGQGVMHKFYDAHKRVHEFHSAAVSSSQEYDNKATEAWFHLGALVKKHGCNFPKDNRLIRQLCTRQYYITKNGKLIIESKPDYVKRMRDEAGDEATSPDRADALVMAFYDQITSGGAVAVGGARRAIGAKVR